MKIVKLVNCLPKKSCHMAAAESWRTTITLEIFKSTIPKDLQEFLLDFRGFDLSFLLLRPRFFSGTIRKNSTRKPHLLASLQEAAGQKTDCTKV